MSISHPGPWKRLCDLLAEKGEGARVLAGGTDLLIRMKQGLLKPQAIIGLEGIQGLKAIRFQPKIGLTIGAMARLVDVTSHPAIRKHYPAVAYAAQETANVQVRNMGTVAGKPLQCRSFRGQRPHPDGPGRGSHSGRPGRRKTAAPGSVL